MSEEQKTQKTVPVATASGPELRRFAEQYLGMTFPQTERVETVRAKVASAWDQADIPVVEKGSKPAEGPPAGEVGPAIAADAAAKKIKIIIQSTEEPGGSDPVPVGVNGKVMLIPRGEEVDVPAPYVHVLRNAKQDRYEINDDGSLGAKREVLAYPFSVVGV